MRPYIPAVLCVLAVSGSSLLAQSAAIQPIRATAGTTLTFCSQIRLNPGPSNPLDLLPKGTELKVKLLESIDSRVDPDGLEFHGLLSGPLISGKEVLVHPGAEVRGLLVLLRSRNHPKGFRYELLITSITENGKAYELTASLNRSLLDSSVPPAANANSKAVTREAGKESQPDVAEAPESKN